MRICTDIEVLQETDNVRTLLKDMLHGRNRITILVGCFGDLPKEQEVLSHLDELGIKKGIHYTYLMRIPGFLPQQIAIGYALYCRDMQVDMFFAKDDLTISQVNLQSPLTTCFLMRRFSEKSNEALMNLAPKK